METPLSLASVCDDVLICRLGELVSSSRRVEADLIAHVGEVEARRLYAREASPSMFAYCTERLHLSEAEAYARITVARAARRHPALFAMLRDGRLHLSGLVRLVPHLTAENRDRLLERATHRSKRQIEELVAELFPRPDVPTVVRKLPVRRAPTEASSAAASLSESGAAAVELCPGRVAPAAPDRPISPASDNWVSVPIAPGAPPSAPLSGPIVSAISGSSRPAVVEPLSPARYKVQFTASAALRDKLARLQALMRSEVPDGDLAAIIDRAVSEKLERLEARRLAKTSAPRKRVADSRITPTSRHVPAAVRRAVLERDGNRCGYVDDKGRRCTEVHRLEYHHRRPFGMGGDHSPANIGLRCRSHNLLEAESDYGVVAVRRPSREEGAVGRSVKRTGRSRSVIVQPGPAPDM